MIEQNQDTEQKTQDAEVLSISNETQLSIVEKDFNSLFEGTDMKKHLASLKRKYSTLKIDSIEDKPTYLKIKEAISVVRPIRTALEKKIKDANASAKLHIKNVNELGDKYLDEVAKVEDPLWEGREKYETLEKEHKAKLEEEKKLKFESRLKELLENGVSFKGQWYEINDITIGTQMLEEMNDEVYADLLAKVKVQNEANIKEAQRKIQEQALLAQQQENLRLENERKQKELDEQRVQLEKQQAEFKAQQDLLAKQQEDLRIANEKAQREAEEKIQREKAEAEARELAIQKEKEEKEKQQKLETERKLLAERALPYEELGFKHNYTKGTWEISIGNFLKMEISKDGLLSESTPYDSIKKDIEEAKTKELAELAEIEKRKEEARMKLMNEKDAYNDYITRLLNVQSPTLENEQLKNSINSIVSLFKPIN